MVAESACAPDSVQGVSLTCPTAEKRPLSSDFTAH
jgi:hypothetical protein